MADPNPSYKLLLPLLRRHRKAVIVFVAVILTSLAIEGLGVGAVISMLDAWGDGGIVDRIPILSELRSQVNALTLTQRVRLVAMVLLAVVVADSVLQYAKNMLSLRLSISVDAELKSAFIKQVYAVSLRYINQQSSSDLASMLLSETTQSARLLYLIATIVASLVVLVMYLIIMLAISWKLTLLATGLLCIFAIPSRLLVPVSKLHTAGGAIVASRKQLFAITSESLTSVKLAHLYSQELARIRLFNEAANDFLHDLYVSNENVCRTKPLLNIFAVIGLVSLLVA